MKKEEIKAVRWLNENYGDTLRISVNSSLSDIGLLGEILAKYKLASDGDLADGLMKRPRIEDTRTPAGHQSIEGKSVSVYAYSKMQDEYIDKLEQQLSELRKENEILASNQCLVNGAVVGSDGGTPYCKLKEWKKKVEEYAVKHPTDIGLAALLDEIELIKEK